MLRPKIVPGMAGPMNGSMASGKANTAIALIPISAKKVVINSQITISNSRSGLFTFSLNRNLTPILRLQVHNVNSDLC